MHVNWSRALVAAVTFCLPAIGASGQSIRRSADMAAAVNAAEALTEQSAPPPQAFDYSDAYRIRAKIHKASSLATLPLFAAEGIIGQSLYSNPTGGKKDAHLAVAAGIGVLFGVNTVTGVWNLIEARKDPNHRKRRLLHGLLMLGADAGAIVGDRQSYAGMRPGHTQLELTAAWRGGYRVQGQVQYGVAQALTMR